MTERTRTALTIAGSDSGGGAGIQADLKTFEAHGLFGMSVITSITAQNTRGVTGVWDLPPEAVRAQLEALFDDLPVDVIKIGMLSNNDITEVVADVLEGYSQDIPIILDPVMVATSGDRLLSEDTYNSMTSRLFPLATLVTPNIREAEVLWGHEIRGEEEMAEGGKAMCRFGSKGVLITGGDGDDEEEVIDLFFNGEEIFSFKGERIKSRDTHGTGCTLSSAIAANLALGAGIVEAIERAREYVRQGIIAAPGLGNGHGPLRHRIPVPGHGA